MKIGHGFDVHKLVSGRPLILGGVKIDYGKGLLGHSDADVVCHALMDAILGAAKMEDIGHLFPDTDDKFKDANSLDLLHSVVKLVSEQGFKIVDADITVAAEAPKLAKYEPKMRQNMAKAAGIDVSCIGISATTTEGLGFTGRGEGICAWSVVLLDEA